MNLNKVTQHINPGNRNGLLNKAIDSGRVQKALSQLSNEKALASVLLLETTVIAGRCYQAKKRGGWIEARERFAEEVSTSIVWLFGVGFLSKTADLILKRFGFETDVDITSHKNSNSLINRIKNSIHKNTVFGRFFNAEHVSAGIKAEQRGWQHLNVMDLSETFAVGRKKLFERKNTTAKFGKVILSAAGALYLVGSVIPKINQAITRKIIAGEIDKNENNQSIQDNFKQDKFFGVSSRHGQSSFKQAHNMQAYLYSVKRKNVSFGSGSLFNFVKTATNALENDQRCKILTVDAGILAGRTSHARNENEKKEIFLRDALSIVFYTFSTHWIISGLSNLFDEKHKLNTKVETGVAKLLADRIIGEGKNNGIVEEIAEDGQISLEELRNRILGVENQPLTEKLQKLLGQNDDKLALNEFVSELDKSGLDRKLMADKVSSINAQRVAYYDVREISNMLMESEKDTKLANAFSNLADKLYQQSMIGRQFDIAEELDKLMPGVEKSAHAGRIQELISGAKVKANDKFVITAQIDDIVKGGLINDVEFIGEAFAKSTLNSKMPDSINPRKHVSSETFNDIKYEIRKYAERMMDRAKMELKELDKASVEIFMTSIKNKNSLARMGYTAVGLGVSAFFLSFVIPKLQYFMTKTTTGKDDFPVVQDIKDQIKAERLKIEN